MLFLDTHVLLFNRDGFQVQWRWDPQGTDPSVCELEVLRSEGTNGPYDQVALLDPKRSYSVFDAMGPVRTQNQEIYYRVRAVNRSTGAELGISKPFGMQLDLPLDALEIIRQQRILLEGVNGQKPLKGIPGLVSVYRKRNFGRPCPDCRDAETGRIIISNCRLCSGTGKLDGFYDGVDVGANIMPNGVALKLGLQKVEDSESTGTMNNFPVVYPGDILVEPSEVHWRITRVDRKERHRAIVRQIVYLTQLKPDDICYETLRHSSHGGKLIRLD